MGWENSVLNAYISLVWAYLHPVKLASWAEHSYVRIFEIF